MSCVEVRTALLEGTRLDGGLRVHVQTCPVCAPLVSGPRRVSSPSPRPSIVALRARSTRRIASFAACAVLGIAGAAWMTTPAPPPELFPDRFADLSLPLTAPLLDDPFAPIDPLAGFEDPTDLLAEAVLGKGPL